MAIEEQTQPASEEPRRNQAMTAALIGGAAAAAAGAVWGARRAMRRNAEGNAPLNSVMETAVTATELGCGRVPAEEKARKEPPVPTEPPVRAG
jgi:hypothetical protein